MSQAAIKLEHNAFGQLVFIGDDGAAHPVTPVRSFPIAAPTEGIGLVNGEGDELAWVERIDSGDFDLGLLGGLWGPDPENLKLRVGTDGGVNGFNYSNPEIDALVARIDEKLCAHDPEILRANAKIRREVAAEATALVSEVDAILAAMGGEDQE